MKNNRSEPTGRFSAIRRGTLAFEELVRNDYEKAFWFLYATIWVVIAVLSCWFAVLNPKR